MDDTSFIEFLQALRDSSEDICFSGGALGADREWGILAEKYNAAVVHFSFKQHKYSGHRSEDRVNVPYPFLCEAMNALKKANTTIKRRIPNAFYVLSLLQRNMYQVLLTNSVYAVSDIKDGMVQGGTAWAVQMFLDIDPNNRHRCFVLDKASNEWYQHNGIEWVRCYDVPTPSGKWTGIGSREISTENIKSMEALWLRHQIQIQQVQ